MSPGMVQMAINQRHKLGTYPQEFWVVSIMDEGHGESLGQ